MKIFKLLSGRVLITAVLIIIQLVWLLAFFLELTQYSTIISFAFTVLSLLIVLYIIFHDDNPSFKMPWIVIIMALPLLGGLLYLCFGSKIPQKVLYRKINAMREELSCYLKPNNELYNEILQIDEHVAGSISYIQNYAKYPVCKGTNSTYYPVGEDYYEALLIELEKAEKFIFMEYFILEGGYMWDGILEILKRKVAEGVDVRLIYDDVGSLFVLPRKFYLEMESYGIKCLPFNPFTPIVSVVVNNRDHRKITVIDGKVAFTGGINIADEYINKKDRYGHWKDTGIKVVGKAVDNFTLMFLEMWKAFKVCEEPVENFIKVGKESVADDGYVLPFSDSPLDGEPVSQSVYIDILYKAKDYVYIFTPYLIIDDEMQNALRYASKRGVDVLIITPGVPDKKIVYRMTRSYYKILMESGVKIYEYAPGFLHAKSYVSDDEIAVVGTINMDYRSLYFHFECGIYLYKTKSVMQVKKDFNDTLLKCNEIKQENMKQGFFLRVLDAIIRVFAPLM